jgi:hypothetical protein
LRVDSVLELEGRRRRRRRTNKKRLCVSLCPTLLGSVGRFFDIVLAFERTVVLVAS